MYTLENGKKINDDIVTIEKKIPAQTFLETYSKKELEQRKNSILQDIDNANKKLLEINSLLDMFK